MKIELKRLDKDKEAQFIEFRFWSFFKWWFICSIVSVVLWYIILFAIGFLFDY